VGGPIAVGATVALGQAEAGIERRDLVELAR
jgi:hypothetical protein